MNVTSSPVRLLFGLVLLIILLLNGAMTALFGWNYLGGAFGGSSTFASLAGALYAVLILDLAAIAYFGMYSSVAETKSQRTITLVVGSAALAGSIFATIVQLSNSAFGLTAWGAYQETIENIALVWMITLTAVHVLVFIGYGLFSASGRVRQKAIVIKTQVADDALKELDARMKDESANLASQMAADMRRTVLNELGFSESGQHSATELRPAAQQQPRRGFLGLSRPGGGGLGSGAAASQDNDNRPT